MKKLIAFTMALSILSCGGMYVRSVYAADTDTSIQNTQTEEKNSDLAYITEAITNLLEYRGQLLGWNLLQEEVDGSTKVVVEYYCVDTRVVDLVRECIADQNLDESLVVFRTMPGNAEDPANRITDMETIYNLMSAYVQENGLACKVEMINEKTQEKENPDTVLFYFNWRCIKEVQVLKQYMASVNIDDSQHVLWWCECEAGSEDPDITTTTVTTAEQGETTTTTTTVQSVTTGEAVIESTTTAENQGDLPQTGNNTMRNLLAALGACGLIGTGMAAVHASGIIQRKKDDEV